MARGDLYLVHHSDGTPTTVVEETEMLDLLRSLWNPGIHRSFFLGPYDRMGEATPGATLWVSSITRAPADQGKGPLPPGVIIETLLAMQADPRVSVTYAEPYDPTNLAHAVYLAEGSPISG